MGTTSRCFGKTHPDNSNQEGVVSGKQCNAAVMNVELDQISTRGRAHALQRESRGDGERSAPSRWLAGMLPGSGGSSAGVLVWVILGHLLALGGLIVSSITAHYGPWADLSSIVVLGSVWMYLRRSNEAEKGRRMLSSLGHTRENHIDLTSAFLLPASLLLPMPMAFAVLVIVRSHRYRIARTPLFRMTFSTSAIWVSMVSAHAIAMTTSLWRYLPEDTASPPRSSLLLLAPIAALSCVAGVYFGTQAVLLLRRARRRNLMQWWRNQMASLRPLSGRGRVTTLLAATFVIIAVAAAVIIQRAVLAPVTDMIGAAGVYFVAQTVLIGGVRGLESRDWSWAKLVGGAKTNALFAQTLMAGALVAVMLTQRAALVLLPVAALLLAGWTRLLARLERSRTDALTGLLRREGLEEENNETITVAPYTAVLVVDLDGLKGINERYGYSAGGDRALHCVGRRMLEATRADQDLVCRWGGDENVAVLPGLVESTACTVAERIRYSVETSTLKVTRAVSGREEVLHPTVTVTVVLAPSEGSTIQDLVDIAHGASAHGKGYGLTNRVVRARTPMLEPTLPLEFPSEMPTMLRPTSRTVALV